MFQFVANLKPYNVYRGRGNDRFDAYLLSVDYLSQHRKLSQLIVDERKTLCADNGNVDLIVDAIRQNSDGAAALHKERRKEEKSLDRMARPGDLSNQLTRRFQKFSNEVFSRLKSNPNKEHVRQVLEMQNLMSPTYIVGMEDFTIVTLTALNIERQYAQLPLSWYQRSTKRALEFAEKTKRNEYGTIEGEVFAGLHAMDYDTAVQVGQMAAESEIDGIATGLVSAMKDPGYMDFRIQDGNIVDLDRSVPRPYIRTMEIISGMHLGYKSISGKRLRFHGLGVGTPILLPMVGLLSRRKGFTAIDSTAPIKDAYSSRTISLYVDTPAPRKLKAHRIIEFWLARNIGWTCKCPYCREFNKNHDIHLSKARKWWKSVGERRLRSGDVRSPSPLAEFIPLLSSSKNKATRRAAGLARIRHNHWVMKRIEKNVQDLSRRPRSLRNWVNNQMEIYLSLPGSSARWQAAARVAWDITNNTFDDLSS